METPTENTIRELLDQYKADLLREVQAMFVQVLEDIQEDHQRRLDDITLQFESMQEYIGTVIDQSAANITEQVAPPRRRQPKGSSKKASKQKDKADDISLDELPY